MATRLARWWAPVAFALIGGALPRFAAAQDESSNRNENPVYDQIVEQFIQYDIGNLRDPMLIPEVVGRFNALRTDEAVPALVRGLNRATHMRASCPITAISAKLRGIVQASRNPEIGPYVLSHLERRNVGKYNHHLAGVFSAAEQQMVRVKGKEHAEQQFKRRANEDQQRMAYSPGMKLTELAPRDPTAGRGAEGASSRPTPAAPPTPNATQLRKMSTEQLIEQLDDERSRKKVLDELHERAGRSDQQVSEHADAAARLLKDKDPAVRESAARLLGVLRIESAVGQLIDALEDEDDAVRSAAATALSRTTRQLFGPSDSATPAEVSQAVARWRQWWAGRSGSAASSQKP